MWVWVGVMWLWCCDTVECGSVGAGRACYSGNNYALLRVLERDPSIVIDALLCAVQPQYVGF